MITNEEIVAAAKIAYDKNHEAIKRTKRKMAPLDKNGDGWAALRKRLKAFRRARRCARIEIDLIADPGKFYNTRFFKRRPKNYKWEVPLGKEFVQRYNIKSMVDFGCGTGEFLAGALEGGVTNLRGFELSYDIASTYTRKEVKPFISQADVSLPIDCGKFDLVWSIEVAEHIFPGRSEIFVDNLVNAASNLIVVSASNSGGTGHGHINPQPLDYWVDLFTARGCKHLPAEVQATKAAWRKLKHKQYLLRHLMIFKVK